MSHENENNERPTRSTVKWYCNFCPTEKYVYRKCLREPSCYFAVAEDTSNLQSTVTYFHKGQVSGRWQGLGVGSQTVFAVTSSINELEDNI